MELIFFFPLLPSLMKCFAEIASRVNSKWTPPPTKEMKPFIIIDITALQIDVSFFSFCSIDILFTQTHFPCYLTVSQYRYHNPVGYLLQRTADDEPHLPGFWWLSAGLWPSNMCDGAVPFLPRADTVKSALVLLPAGVSQSHLRWYNWTYWTTETVIMLVRFGLDRENCWTELGSLPTVKYGLTTQCCGRNGVKSDSFL